MLILCNCIGLRDGHCDYPIYFLLDILYYYFIGGDVVSGVVESVGGVGFITVLVLALLVLVVSCCLLVVLVLLLSWCWVVVLVVC